MRMPGVTQHARKTTTTLAPLMVTDPEAKSRAEPPACPRVPAMTWKKAGSLATHGRRRPRPARIAWLYHDRRLVRLYIQGRRMTFLAVPATGGEHHSRCRCSCRGYAYRMADRPGCGGGRTSVTSEPVPKLAQEQW